MIMMIISRLLIIFFRWVMISFRRQIIFFRKLMIFFRWLMLPQLRRARSGHKMVVTNGKLTVNLNSTKGHQDLSWLLVNIIRRGRCNNNFKCNYCDMFSHFLKVLGNRQYNQYGLFQTFPFLSCPYAPPYNF